MGRHGPSVHNPRRHRPVRHGLDDKLHRTIAEQEGIPTARRAGEPREGHRGVSDVPDAALVVERPPISLAYDVPGLAKIAEPDLGPLEVRHEGHGRTYPSARAM